MAAAREVKSIVHGPTNADTPSSIGATLVPPLGNKPTTLPPTFVRDADVFSRACHVGNEQHLYAAWVKARALAGNQRRDALPPAASGLSPAQIRDLVWSVLDSPKYVAEVGGEFAAVIWDNISLVTLSTLGLIVLESASGVALASGNPLGESAALMIQAGLGIATGYAVTQVGEAIKRDGEEWVRLATTATSPLERAEASKAFLKTLGGILMAGSTAKAALRNGRNIVGIVSSGIPATGMRELAAAGIGNVGSVGAATSVAASLTPGRPVVTPVWLATQNAEGGGGAPKQAPARHFGDKAMAEHTETMLSLADKRTTLPLPEFLAEIGKAIDALAKVSKQKSVNVRAGKSGRFDRKTWEVELDPGHLDGNDLYYMRKIAAQSAQVAHEMQQVVLAARYLAGQGKDVAAIAEQLGIHRRIAAEAKLNPERLSPVQVGQAERFLGEIKTRDDFTRAEKAWQTAKEEMQRASASGDQHQLEAALSANKHVLRDYEHAKVARDAVPGQREHEAVATDVESHFISASERRPGRGDGHKAPGRREYLFGEHSMIAFAHMMHSLIRRPSQSTTARLATIETTLKREFTKSGLPPMAIKARNDMPPEIHGYLNWEEWTFVFNAELLPAGALTLDMAAMLTDALMRGVRGAEQRFGALSHQVNHLRIPDGTLLAEGYPPSLLVAAKKDRHRPVQTEPDFRALSPAGDQYAIGAHLDQSLHHAYDATKRAETELFVDEIKTAMQGTAKGAEPSAPSSSIDAFRRAQENFERVLDQKFRMPLAVAQQEAASQAEQILRSIVSEP